MGELAGKSGLGFHSIFRTHKEMGWILRAGIWGAVAQGCNQSDWRKIPLIWGANRYRSLGLNRV
mgnify:FL=1